MTWRLLVLSVCLMLSAAWNARSMETEQVPLRQPLARLPFRVGGWIGRDLPPFAPNIVTTLGVDEYLSRVYVPGNQREQSYVSVYIGYYKSQREGDTIHSPMNCLPGAGWQPVTSSRVAIRVAGRDPSIMVNRYLIQKGGEKQVALYWY